MNTVNCYFCKKEVPDSESSNADAYNNDDGGSICEQCLDMDYDRDDLEIIKVEHGLQIVNGNERIYAAFDRVDVIDYKIVQTCLKALCEEDKTISLHTNKDRADLIKSVLENQMDGPEYACDLIVNIKHYCDEYGYDFNEHMERAEYHYQTERES